MSSPTRQISLRISDSLVSAMDEAVAAEMARSRADIVESAVERELRRLIALRDVEILRDAPEPEADLIVNWVSQNVALDD
nr:Uncharacterised protein [Streptococcus thermophilus]